DSSNHLISEPEPDSIPQPPASRGSIPENREEEKEDRGDQPIPEHFAFFRDNYPDRDLWAWPKALSVFAELSAADQEKAAAASPHYATKIVATKRKPPPVRPERFLRDRIFENFPHARLPEKPPPEAPKVFYAEGSDGFAAISVALAVAGLKPIE